MFCGKCGNEIQNNVPFCPNCGNQVNTASQQSNLNSQIKNKKRLNVKVLIISLVLVIALTVVGISVAVVNNTNNSIVGSWADPDGNIRFSFYEDGTCDAQYPYYEAAENGTLRFFDSYHYPSGGITYYEVHGNKLYLSTKKNFEINDENTGLFYRK